MMPRKKRIALAIAIPSIIVIIIIITGILLYLNTDMFNNFCDSGCFSYICYNSFSIIFQYRYV